MTAYEVAYDLSGSIPKDLMGKLIQDVVEAPTEATADYAGIDTAKLEALVVQLKRVGLTQVERFKLFISNPSSFFEDTAEWTELTPRVRFIFSKGRATGVLFGGYVTEFIRGGSEYSAELLAEVNAELAFIFSEVWISDEEAAKLEAVDVLSVSYDDQIAVVVRPDGRQIAINLWELHGRSRRADGFTSPRFRDSGRI